MILVLVLYQSEYQAHINQNLKSKEMLRRNSKNNAHQIKLALVVF